VWYGTTGNGGVGDLSEQWMAHFWAWWVSYDSSINPLKLTWQNVQNCDFASYSNLKLYAQPGGNSYDMQMKLGSRGKNNINNYLNRNGNPGAYFGVCAGWYYASSDYYWQGQLYKWPNLLGRAPTAEGSIIDLADYESKDPFAITRSSSQDKSFLESVVYYGGPTRGWHDTPDNVPGETLLVFDEAQAKDGKPLIAAWTTADEKMLLTSAHMEAYEDIGIEGYMPQDRQMNYIWLANSLNKVMGTSFRVPTRDEPISFVARNSTDSIFQ
jgi:glutamine amidotransferase-like uncharacterized protein